MRRHSRIISSRGVGAKASLAATTERLTWRTLFLSRPVVGRWTGRHAAWICNSHVSRRSSTRACLPPVSQCATRPDGHQSSICGGFIPAWIPARSTFRRRRAIHPTVGPRGRGGDWLRPEWVYRTDPGVDSVAKFVPPRSSSECGGNGSGRHDLHGRSSTTQEVGRLGLERAYGVMGQRRSMSGDLFEKIANPTVKVGTQKWYAGPLSVVVHVVTIAGILTVPIAGGRRASEVIHLGVRRCGAVASTDAATSASAGTRDPRSTSATLRGYSSCGYRAEDDPVSEFRPEQR